MSFEVDRIVFLDRGTLPPQTVMRAPARPHHLVCHEATDAASVAERIAAANIVISNKVRVTREAMQRAPQLRLIAVAATGVNNVDIAAARELNIAVCNVRDYATHSLPEHTLALILNLRRSISAYHDSVARGRWSEAGQFCYFDFPIRDLAGDTLGIIGFGALGRAVAALAKAFGMHVLVAEHKGAAAIRAGYVPFEEVLGRSDILTLHLPLQPATQNLISTPEFELMKRRPLLINTARGGLVDEMALVEALDKGRIAGAGFDVATSEPAPAGHILMRLLNRPNFLMTPHVAWTSEQATQTLADQVIDNIDAFVGGAPRNLL